MGCAGSGTGEKQIREERGLVAAKRVKVLLIERSVNKCPLQHAEDQGDTMQTSTAFESIRLEVAEGVATLTLNRPDRLNSFTAAMHGEVRRALDIVRNDPAVRCFVLTGAGRGFCAGQDLGDRVVAPGAAPVDLGETIETHSMPL